MPPTDPTLEPIAITIGEAWANEMVRSLRSEQREVVGAWPGTLSEARVRIRAVLQRNFEREILDDLARIANLAARRGWAEVSEADPEA